MSVGTPEYQQGINMKTITMILDNGKVSALDIPDGVMLRVMITDTPMSSVRLANGKMAAVTELLPDTERLNSLSPNARTADGTPHRPDLVYADEWQGWADFLGWVPMVDGQ
jgi:hypothetical protein